VLVGDTVLRSPSVYQVVFPFGRYDTLPVSALVDLVILIFPIPLTLKLVRIIARGVGNLPTKIGVSRTFCSPLIDQHLSDESR